MLSALHVTKKGDVLNQNVTALFLKISDEPIIKLVTIEVMYAIFKQSHTAVCHGLNVSEVPMSVK